jgi:hypothetical protein
MNRLKLHHFIAVNTLKFMQKSSSNSAELLNTYVKAKTKKFFWQKQRKYVNFFKKCQYKSSFHCFYALIFLVVKALGNGGKFGKR